MLWQTTRFQIDLSQPQVMGIVNLTPDSFSDGGSYVDPRLAIAHAERLLADGAQMLDLGAESTRPGAKPIDDAQEWARLEPVLTELLRWKVPLSVDTYRPATMARALALGVDIINDIWGLRQPGALASVAGYACGLCVMHMHGEPESMQLHPMADPALPQVAGFLRQRLQDMEAAGIDPVRIVLDPGIGFGKTVRQNFELLSDQARLLDCGRPLLLGWSRKSSLGAVTGLPVEERLVPSVVASVLALDRGAAVVRVHDVAATVAGMKVWRAAICEN